MLSFSTLWLFFVFFLPFLLCSDVNTSSRFRRTHAVPEARRLTERARFIEGYCTRRQKDTMKTIIKDLSQLSLFAIQAANVGTLPQPGSRAGGARFPEGNMRAFQRRLQPLFELCFDTYAPTVRHDVARRFRNLKYETDRTVGNIMGESNHGHVVIECDNRLRYARCRDTPATLVSHVRANHLIMVRSLPHLPIFPPRGHRDPSEMTHADSSTFRSVLNSLLRLPRNRFTRLSTTPR